MLDDRWREAVAAMGEETHAPSKPTALRDIEHHVMWMGLRNRTVVFGFHRNARSDGYDVVACQEIG
jgi:hypothetical protein